jgi:hypothetical protein
MVLGWRTVPKTNTHRTRRLEFLGLALLSLALASAAEQNTPRSEPPPSDTTDSRRACRRRQPAALPRGADQ